MDSSKQIGLLRNSANYSHDSRNDAQVVYFVDFFNHQSMKLQKGCIVWNHVLSKHIEASERSANISQYWFELWRCILYTCHLLQNVARCSQHSQAKSKLPKKSLVANAPFWAVTSSSHTLIRIASRCLLFIAIREMMKTYWEDLFFLHQKNRSCSLRFHRMARLKRCIPSWDLSSWFWTGQG